MTRVLIGIGILTTLFSLKSASQVSFIKNLDPKSPFRLFSVLPQNFYTQHTGFVCKKEDQLQKATGLNLFIRLGSKNYVDYLERKPNAVSPYLIR